MQQLRILATTAAGGPSRGTTNLNTTTPAPTDLTITAGSTKERCREKMLPFVTDFWSNRCSDPASRLLVFGIVMLRVVLDELDKLNTVSVDTTSLIKESNICQRV